MKKTIFLLLGITFTSLSGFAQNVNITDANFKAYLVGNTAINTNSDSEIQVSEAAAFAGTINCNSSSISELTGVEAFTNLTELNINGNNISALDVSSNINLTKLNCGNNNISTLDVSGNFNLTWLNISNNILTQFDISSNTNLNTFFCLGNDLTSLNAKNISPLVLTTFFASNNPNLTCIEVDNVADATANWTNIDATANFSTDCAVFLGVNDFNLSAELTISPNPTSSNLTIQSDEKIEVISIVDFTGKTTETVWNTSNSIDVSHLPAGIYFLQIQTASGVVSKTFIKD